MPTDNSSYSASPSARGAGGGIIPLQDSVVYGPIASRRLGQSLGINLLPLTHKVCSSNCVYCQYGWTPPPGVRPTGPRIAGGDAAAGGTPGGGAIKRAAELLTEIERAFQDLRTTGTRVDCITLAGNGEPTLHPDLLEIVVGLRGLRDAYFPGASVGILSDATQLMRPAVRQALELLDTRCLKFDAADEATWRRINKPMGRTSFDAMVETLRAVPDIILQSMFLQGSYDNTDEPHVAAWIEAVRSIRPSSVQVYTVDRGTADPGITEVPRETLQRIADRLTAATGVPADVYD